MSENQRQAQIPIEYLVSEIIAFPLASVVAFANPFVALDLEVKCETAILWREAERHVTRIGPDISIDMALAIRDQFWFPTTPETENSNTFKLYEYLRKLSKDFLDLRGNHAVPKSAVSDPVYEREKEVSPSHRSNKMLRWLSFSLPVDLLLGGVSTNTCPPNTVEFLPSQLYQNLQEKGFAETHVHVGGSMQFPEFWVTVLNMMGNHKMKDDAFQSPGAEMSEGRFLVPWLLRGAICRLLLARFLYRKPDPGMSFSDWLNQVLFQKIIKSRGRTGLEVLKLSLSELLQGRFNNKLHMTNDFLRSLYREMINPYLVYSMVDHPQLIQSCDPIAQLTKYSNEKSPNPEICFVHRSLRYMNSLEKDKKGKTKDLLFESLFWQVVRLRCILYRHVTQRPMTPGLLWFIRHYDRISPGRKNTDDRLMVRTTAVSSGLGKGLKALEARKSPGNTISEILELVNHGIASIRYFNQINYVDQSFTKKLPPPFKPLLEHRIKDTDPIEFCWIFHFEKIRGEATVKGLDKPNWKHTYADPSYQPLKTKALPRRMNQNRYAAYYRPRKYRALLLARVLMQYPMSLKVIRGIDVCTDELGIPTWVLAPILRYIDDAGKIASQHLKLRFGEEVPPLKKTVHSGEDFVHLIGGLRRIDEAVRYFRLGPGDRIGHAMALGMEPAAWANRMHRVTMRIEDRLKDLIWEWTQYSSHVLQSESKRIAYVEREIARLSIKIFSRDYTPFELENLFDLLHNEQILKKVKYPHCELDRLSSDKNAKPEYKEFDPDTGLCQSNFSILKRYLTDPEIFERGNQAEWFSVIPEIETIITLQNHIRRKIGGLGIVVEVNPSSNLLIGNIADLKNHPFWRLDPPDKSRDIPPVALCIGSDDPLTFATNLRKEYAIVYESLIDGGLSAKEAWEWVDRIRKVGMNSRFTLKTTSCFGPEISNRIGYKENYSVIDDNMPQFYWVLGLDKTIHPMP